MKRYLAVLGFCLFVPVAAANEPSEMSDAITACADQAIGEGNIVKGWLNGGTTVHLKCTGGAAADLYNVLNENGWPHSDARPSDGSVGWQIVFGNAMCQWLWRDGRGRKINFTGCYLPLEIGDEAISLY